MERIINVEKENQEQTINIINEGTEQEIEIVNEQEETNVPVEKEMFIIGSAVFDHSKLQKLNFNESGHIGFQEEMDSITNLEIERMWNSV